MTVGTLTTAQLLTLSRSGSNITPPAGFVAISSDKLNTPNDLQARIDYKGFYNAKINELIITGTPKPVTSGGLWSSNQQDRGIFGSKLSAQGGSTHA
jgi:hypothetical protein